MNPGHPYACEPHLAAWAVLWLAALAIVGGHRHVRRRNVEATRWTPRQMPAFTGAGAAAAVALTWPLGDLAAHWSLTTLVIQRLILTLAVASLVLVLVGMRGDRRRGRAVHRDGGGLDGHSRGGGRSLVAGRAGVDGSGGSGGRPLYSTFGHSHLAVGLRPLNDLEISGFVSKLTMLFVLFSVGAVVLN